MTVRRALPLGATVAGACSILLGCTAPASVSRPAVPHSAVAQPAAPSAAAPSPTARPAAGSPSAATHASLRDLGARLGLRVGTAVRPKELAISAYRSLIAHQFSTVTPENEMKWGLVEPLRGRYDWAPADRLVAFAKQHGQLVRGHTLVWHREVPSWLRAGVANGRIGKTQLRALLKKHITEEVSHFKGKVWQWDVVNEAFSDPSAGHGTSAPARFWVEHLGAGVLADAFRWAHAADPQALLFYNDYGIEDVNAKSTAVVHWIEGLKTHRVPIDGIGFQSHLDTRDPVPSDLTASMQRFVAVGLKVAVTEADVRTSVKAHTNTPRSADAQKLQEANWQQTISSCLAVPACISYTVWGVSDSQSWVPDTYRGEGAALLYDEHLKPKRQYFDVQRALATARGSH